MSCRITFAALVLTLAVQAPADASVYVFGGNPTHPAYGYDGTSRRVDNPICPGVNRPEQYVAARNAAAALNRRDPLPDNVDTTSGDRPGPGDGADFELTLIHEIGHAVGFAHTLNADRSIQTRPGPNNVTDVAPGPDGVIGTEDDTHGDDFADAVWFPTGVPDNSPFVVPTIVDLTTMSRDIQTRERPGTLPWAPSPEVAALFGLPPSFPMTSNGYPDIPGSVVRRPAPDDIVNLNFMEAGPDNLVDTEDDYELFFYVVGEKELPPFRCIVITFPTAGLAPGVLAEARVRHPEALSGFARCYGGLVQPQDDLIFDVCYGTTTIAFSRDFEWFYTTTDTSDGQGSFVRAPNSPDPHVDLGYEGGQSRLLMTYTTPVYTFSEVLVTISSNNGMPFPPDTILFPLFSVVEQSCGMEFYASTQSTEIIQHLDISGETEITALLKIAPESADAVCNLPFRISVPGAGVFTATLNAAVDNGQFVFAHGFE